MQKFNWYMISTITGKEDVVVEALKNRIIAEEVAHNFDSTATQDGAFKIFKKPTLTHKELEKKLNGEIYKIKWVNMYPGYIFIKMDMTDKAWYVIRNTQYVTGLVGSSGKGAKPTPVTQREIKKSLIKEKEALERFETDKNYFALKEGDVVVFENTAYKGTEGTIKSISADSNLVEVIVETFGQNVIVETNIENVRPYNNSDN
ncbi:MULTISPECIES: transcription termination/antitermination protein NusG [unclassified Mycoplasma]|uniref:transcription termination/antitermination protein NusG n=1 Tax=unclassified Mycoplasma TaxID=2683645 RepID=UPI00211BD75C|nr:MULTISPECIES: transcription termination/antitermination protein NusG [unclassified Mycoplasma]UUM20075.1 transcription termination/antitermination protein NusG [Mycoplasma sp. 1578d]UUM25055.1 transcription termination/antitermination protein NusG [Mycoplasma sp. 3686d]